MTTTPDFRSLLVELTELQGHVLVECTEEWADVMDRARAALATPPPEPPADEELKAWYHQWAKSTSWWGHGDRPVHFARAVLERWGK